MPSMPCSHSMFEKVLYLDIIVPRHILQWLCYVISFGTIPCVVLCCGCCGCVVVHIGEDMSGKVEILRRDALNSSECSLRGLGYSCRNMLSIEYAVVVMYELYSMDSFWIISYMIVWVQILRLWYISCLGIKSSTWLVSWKAGSFYLRYTMIWRLILIKKYCALYNLGNRWGYYDVTLHSISYSMRFRILIILLLLLLLFFISIGISISIIFTIQWCHRWVKSQQWEKEYSLRRGVQFVKLLPRKMQSYLDK